MRACVRACVCVLFRQPTLRTLRYAAVLVPQVRLGVGGEAPGADGGVVRVAAVVLPQVLVAELLRHESVEEAEQLLDENTQSAGGGDLFPRMETRPRFLSFVCSFFFFVLRPWRDDSSSR